MTSTHAVQAVAGLSAPGGALDLGRDPARPAIRMLRLLAPEGRPVTRDDAYTAARDMAGALLRYPSSGSR